MLAKEIKIKTLKKQREFIQEKLSQMVHSEDAHATYSYVGHIYPENVKYFEKEGFVITKVNSETLTAMTQGNNVYIFTIDDIIELTEEEKKQAEKYQYSNLYEAFKEIFGEDFEEDSDEDSEEDSEEQFDDLDVEIFLGQ